MVSGSLRATDSLLTTTLQTQILNIPTTSNGTAYGPGTSGNVVSSNGTSIYWRGVTDNSASTAVTSTDTNLITGRTLYYAGYVKSSGVTSVTIKTTAPFTGGSDTAVTSTGTWTIGANIVNNTSVGALGWTGSATTDTNLYLINRNTLAYWNGAYSGTSSNLTVLGTVTTGVWSATKINPNKGGTGIDTYAQGDILYAGAAIANTATTALSKLAIGTANTFLKSTGTAPSWTNTIGNLTIAGTVDTEAGKSISSNSTLYLKTTNGSSVLFYTNSTARSRVDPDGHFRPEETRTYSLGLSDYYWDGAYVHGNGAIHWNNLCYVASKKIVTTDVQRGLPRIIADNGTGITGHGNVLWGMPAEAITYEYTTNGTDWIVGDKTNDQKRNFTNGTWPANVFNVGNVANAASGATCTTAVGYGSRVTLDFQIEARTGWISCLIVRLNTRGMSCKLTVDRWNKNTNTWTIIEDVSLGNTDRWHVIYPEVNMELYGNSSASTARRCNKLRVTLVETAVGTANRYPPNIYGIAGYGDGYASNTINATYKYSRLFDRIVAQQGMPLYISDRLTGVVVAPISELQINGTGSWKNANSETDQEGRTGIAWLTLGNNANINAENTHSEGRIYIYSAATKAHIIRGASTTTDYSHYLPNQTSWIACGGNGTSTGVGGADQIVYLSTTGILTAGTSATSANTASTIVKRDAGGGFSAGSVKIDGNTLYVGSTSATAETGIVLYGKDGSFSLFSHASDGAHGLWAHAHGTDTSGKSVFYLDTNNNVEFFGHLNGNVAGNADTATKATQDSDGNTIKSTYLKLAGGTMTGDIKGNSTTALGTTANPFHNIVLGGTTGTTMTAASTNPRITFQENTGTQPVHLIYTDADTYRAPAGLKVIGGTDATPAWFEVEGQVLIGARVTSTAPSSLSSINRLVIVPYFHTGGPWIIKSRDDSSNAYLSLYYNTTELIRIKHDGTQALDWKGNAATATRINGNLSAASGSVNHNIWVSSTAGADGIPRYVSNCYINESGYLYTTRVYNAVWNDYAEYRYVETEEPGYCVTETASGKMIKTNRRLQAGCKVTSDTYGACMGKTEIAKTPIAISGRVLVHPYRNRQEYALGVAVCSAPNGTVDIMTRDEIMMYPERIVGTVSEIPDYETWECGEGKNDTLNHVPVNGRIWIYVK